MLRREVTPLSVKVVKQDTVSGIINNGVKTKGNVAAPVVGKKVSQKEVAGSLKGTLITDKLKEYGVTDDQLKQLNKSDIIAKLAQTLKEKDAVTEKSKKTAIPWEDVEIQLLIKKHLKDSETFTAKQLGERIGKTLGRAPPAKSTLSDYLKKYKAGNVSSYATTKDYKIKFSKKLNEHLIVTSYPDCRAFIYNKTAGDTNYYRCHSCDKAHKEFPDEKDTRATAIECDNRLRYKLEHHPLCDALDEDAFNVLLILRETRDLLRKDKTILPKQGYEIGKQKAREKGEAINEYELYDKYRCGHTRAANYTNEEQEEEAEEKMNGFKEKLRDGCWIINSNKSNKLYSSPALLDLFSTCQKAVCDATFAPAPRKFKQVWTIHSLYERDDGSREWVPIATAIMKRKTFHAYKQVIGWLKQAMIDRLLEWTNIERIHVDFERAQYNAFKYHFGDIIYGCSFHLAQGVIRKAQKIGLMRFYHIDEVRRWVRSLMALNMLPYEHAVRLFNLHCCKPPKRPQDQKKWPEKKHFKNMAKYMKKTWLTDKLKISFFGLRIVRNINAAEAFNGKLQRDPYVKKHPALPQFKVILTRLFDENETRIYQLRQGKSTRKIVKKYEEMDRILAEKEERYKKLVISKYDDLTDDEFVELAKNHVRECSYLLQRAKKTKAFIKKVIKQEIKSKKEKVVATDDENDEDVDNVEISKPPDMFESDEDLGSDGDDYQSGSEDDDEYIDSDESDDDSDSDDDFFESYIHSDFQSKDNKSSFDTPSSQSSSTPPKPPAKKAKKKKRPAKKLTKNKKNSPSSHSSSTPASTPPKPPKKKSKKDEDVSRSFPWSNVPTPPTPNSEKLKYDEKDSSPLSTAPKTPSSFLPPKRKQTLSGKSKKSPLKGRKRKYSKTVAKYKVSKADSSLIPVTDSTQKDKSESFDLAVYADYGMPSFEFEFNPPSDAFLESLVTFIKFREPNLNLERLREASPLRKMGKAAIVGAPQRYYNVNADGNCGWRCISYALFGTVIYHWYIRKIITKWQAFGDDPRVAAEALPKWKIIEKQEERSTVKERHLWISETDLIAVAKYFRINILCYKHGMGDLEFDHWVCYSPDHSKNKKLEQEEEKYPDLCIDWSFTGEHYRVVTEFVTVL